jgi:hypothetical protein
MSQLSNFTTPVVLAAGSRHGLQRPDMKTRYLVVLVVGALAVGIGSGWALLGERPPFGAVHLGPWQSFPRMGSSDVDPYSRAILARGPHLPLAAGEGVQLLAQADSSGASLDAACRYLLSGSTLPSRGWTLSVTDRANRTVKGEDMAALSDADLVSDEKGEVRITASTRISSGTWLKLPAEGRFGLILRFYDTPSSSAIGQLPLSALPRIERLACGSTS